MFEDGRVDFWYTSRSANELNAWCVHCNESISIDFTPFRSVNIRNDKTRMWKSMVLRKYMQLKVQRDLCTCND